ncbi:MAG: type IV secretory system conjugative DNA transfer family protein [Brevundimonas sp.]|uniref:type IV secretory system conjugative DNA transfer family protein n=1 Tax=Brevundimonas sp. TaxID=1871086 RepID=UPI001A29AFBA|nr:type IV secretory system conjugative DNA transfer family protein [Brevundimonas sp.]MBJ7317159.1 type IV secretory system conjugative DNA transfer family protein [Brevundimonas sp.]MDK2745707.1 type IV secretory system conjugative DNA transfer family protein [Brevundimonas sp.]
MTRFASATPAARAGLIAAAIAACLGLVVVGAFLIALAGLGRLSAEVEPALVPAWFWYYRHDPAVTRWLTVGVSTSGLAALVLVGAALLHHRRPLHGAARWASAGEQRRAGLRAGSGILLGRADGGFLIADGPEHVMLYAPTRTGKGVGVVIPNLLAWPGSVVVLDIKRENFIATAGYRAEAGQTVHLFDPLAPDGRTSRFNPLGHVERSDATAVLDELQRMAAMLFPAHPKADPFWAEAARSGFIGVGGYIAATPELPFTLGEIYRQLTAGDARTRLPRLIKTRAAEGRPLPGPVASALRDFTEASENTFASVRQSITTRMGLWLNPQVDAATAASDFDLAALRGGRLSLYLGATPDNLLRVQPLYALLFQQIIDLNSRTLPGPDDQPALIVLDEFARLGSAPVLAHAFAWVAGYGLRLLAVLQSPSQLRGLYGPDLTEDILTNCGVEVVFAPKALRVAQELSERLGYATVPGLSRSRPTGLGAGRRSTTVSDQRRALLLPQELMQLPSDRLLVLKAGTQPTRGRKIVYWRERVFVRRLRPAPEIAPLAVIPPSVSPTPIKEDPLDFDVIARAFAAEGLPPPPPGADTVAVGVWLDRVLDAPVREVGA